MSIAISPLFEALEQRDALINEALKRFSQIPRLDLMTENMKLRILAGVVFDVVVASEQQMQSEIGES